MSKTEFLQALAEILEVESTSITGNEVLDALDEWDSLNILNFISFADAQGYSDISPQLLAGCRTVNDLYDLLVNRTN